MDIRHLQFTSTLSRLIYCTQLIFLETMLPRFPNAYIGLSARPICVQLGRLKVVRAEKTCDGTVSPLGEFLSLLAYGRALHRTEDRYITSTGVMMAKCFHEMGVRTCP